VLARGLTQRAAGSIAKIITFYHHVW
jgi:hypothetical protein